MSSPAPSSARPSITDRSTSPTHLRVWFTTLAILTGLATLRTLVLPPWPRVASLPSQASLQKAIERAGLRPSPLAGESEQRSIERALSASLAWRLGDGSIVRVRHGAMRRWEDLQMAALTRGLPDLALQGRRLESDRQGRPLAIGKVRSALAQQSCLVPGSSAGKPLGVTYLQLTDVLSQRPNPPKQRLAGLLGLRPIRSYDCVLITLQAPPGAPTSPQTWDRLLTAVVPLLGTPSLTSPNL